MARLGRFIVLEGLDGSGISSHARSLQKYLGKKGVKALLTKEPTSNNIGNMLKANLSDGWHSSFKSLQLLFCADRAKHLEDEIEPALKKGKTVICDRYIFSTLAYGFASGVDFKWLFEVNKAFRVPDLTIFIDISPDISLSRMEKGTKGLRLFERREKLGKVRKAYLNLAKKFNFRIVNGEESEAETNEAVARAVDRYMERSS